MSKPKEKYRYIFPAKLAAAMKKIDTRAQLEASLLSMSLLICGMFLYTLYMIIYVPYGIWMKIMLGFNMFCGIVLLGSYLVTSYQQWVGHLEMMGIDPDKEKEDIKKSGNIFKRIKMARKASKFKKEQEKIKEEQKELTKLKEKAEELSKEEEIKVLLNNIEESKKILAMQGKIELNQTVVVPVEESPKESPREPPKEPTQPIVQPTIEPAPILPLIKSKQNKKQREESLIKLYEEQKKFLENN